MDFTNYPNIASLAKQLGKVKRTAFNKKKFDKNEIFWNSLSSDELSAIDREAADAVRVMNCFVTPNYLFVLDLAVFYLVPVKDAIWIYTTVLTQRMNFIPYNKMHNLILLDRNKNYYTLGTKNTNGFSKKTPCSDAMKQVCEIIYPQRRGLLSGWTEEIEKVVTDNFEAVVQAVDNKSLESKDVDYNGKKHERTIDRIITERIFIDVE